MAKYFVKEERKGKFFFRCLIETLDAEFEFLERIRLRSQLKKEPSRDAILGSSPIASTESA